MGVRSLKSLQDIFRALGEPRSERLDVCWDHLSIARSDFDRVVVGEVNDKIVFQQILTLVVIASGLLDVRLPNIQSIQKIPPNAAENLRPDLGNLRRIAERYMSRERPRKSIGQHPGHQQCDCNS